MQVVDSLIRNESNGTISFGNYTLAEKGKVSDFEHDGDLYKVKTYYEITKLEKNGMFIYESVPGTAVFDMKLTDKEITFCVTGREDAQITMELESEQEYEVLINNVSIGRMKTNLGGKLVFSAEVSEEAATLVQIFKR